MAQRALQNLGCGAHGASGVQVEPTHAVWSYDRCSGGGLVFMQIAEAGLDDGQSMSDVIDAVPAGVVMIDDTGSIVLVNQELERMFGYARRDLMGQSIELLMPERFHLAHRGQRSRYLSDPKRRAM